MSHLLHNNYKLFVKSMLKNDKKKEIVTYEKVVHVGKVSKTVRGGRKFSFTCLLVTGNKKGSVGYAHAKAHEVGDARNKAAEAAKRYMVRVPLKEGRTLHHDTAASFGATTVIIKTAVPGTGIIASGPLRAVFECLGIEDVVSKTLGSSNPYNVLTATFRALTSLDSPKKVAERRGKNVSEIIKNRNLASKTHMSGGNKEEVDIEDEEDNNNKGEE